MFSLLTNIMRYETIKTDCFPAQLFPSSDVRNYGNDKWHDNDMHLMSSVATILEDLSTAFCCLLGVPPSLILFTDLFDTFCTI
jgi:hypothetical protein